MSSKTGEDIVSLLCTQGVLNPMLFLQTCFNAQKKVKTTLNLRAAEGELTEEKHNLGIYTPLLYTKTPVLFVATDRTQENKHLFVFFLTLPLPTPLSSLHANGINKLGLRGKYLVFLSPSTEAYEQKGASKHITIAYITY